MPSTTSILAVILVVAVQGSLSCKFFCKNPATLEYECCDDGNPFINSTTNTETSTESGPTPVTILVGADYTVPGQPDAQSASCRYYCAYANSVYCCDDGSLTLPGDHDVNTGRCPTTGEQVCKDDAVYLALKAEKVGTTKSGTSVLSEIGSGTVMCASDGYCGEDEKCCPSICHKRHVCLKTLHADKTKDSDN